MNFCHTSGHRYIMYNYDKRGSEYFTSISDRTQLHQRSDSSVDGQDIHRPRAGDDQRELDRHLHAIWLLKRLHRLPCWRVAPILLTACAPLHAHLYLISISESPRQPKRLFVRQRWELLLLLATLTKQAEERAKRHWMRHGCWKTRYRSRCS